jgi:dihydroorotate dehydrogenase
MAVYDSFVRPVLFGIDAERVHGWAIATAGLASSLPRFCSAVDGRRRPRDPRLALDVAGLHFDTPLGLAAGFDKSARAVPLLAALGFGHVEVGSISAHRSEGNPKPRLFRIPRDEGIVVNYGLPNDGADPIARRLQGVHASAPLGINIVSTNHGPGSALLPDDEVIADYLASVKTLQPVADYLALNLSCPNTREGRGFFAEPARLRMLLAGLDGVGIAKPLFLKVAPFASSEDLERFLVTVGDAKVVSGFSINLPPGKPPGLATDAAQLAKMPGAVSGRIAAKAADDTIRELYRQVDPKRHRIIGSGGVFTAEDAYRKIRLGATLVQLMTALIYRGPNVVRDINEGLARLLERDGFAKAGDAVGADA